MQTPTSAGSCLGGAIVPVPVSPVTPPTPPASEADLYAELLAGRGMLAEIDQNGLTTVLQPFIGRNLVTMISPLFGSTGFSALGVSPSTDGTPTPRVPNSTNFCQSLQRMGVVSAAGAGSAAGVRVARLGWWFGNAAGLGGFFGVWRFNISDAALVGTANMFAGMRATTGTIVDVDPSTLTNIIGIGCDNGDTHMQLYSSGAAAQPRQDLGANFPVNTTSIDVYELILFAAPNATKVGWRVKRLNTGNIVSGTISAAAQLPSNTTFLEPTAWRSNGGTALAVGIDIERIYLESQN